MKLRSNTINLSATLCLFTLLAAVSMTTTAFPSTLTGIVHEPDGTPKSNVFVTAQDDAQKMAVSVLTNATGHYRIDELFPGQYELRARKAGFDDGVKFEVVLAERDAAVDLSYDPMMLCISRRPLPRG